MLSKLDEITVPVLCPVPDCHEAIDCRLEIETVVGADGGLSLRQTTSTEAVLADVALHIFTEHPGAL
jgi:hypothetical protein